MNKDKTSYFMGGKGQSIWTHPKYIIASYNNRFGKNAFENQNIWEIIKYKLVKVKLDE